MYWNMYLIPFARSVNFNVFLSQVVGRRSQSLCPSNLRPGTRPITDPIVRARLFGQHDHFWRFGPDFVDLLEEAGLRR